MAQQHHVSKADAILCSHWLYQLSNFAWARVSNGKLAILHTLPRRLLMLVTGIWSVTASWLWPQLALWAGLMSHCRPTLLSVLGSASLILVTEGLLETLELIARLVHLSIQAASTATYIWFITLIKRRQEARAATLMLPTKQPKLTWYISEPL